MSMGMIKNKKARKNFHFLDNFTAGIQLIGSEIKSIRSGEINITDSYCILQDGEVFIKDMMIKKYDKTSYNDHEEKRLRKLLLSKKEIRKIERALGPGKTKMSVIPVSLFINERGWAKVNISICQGKKDFDKRNDLREKDLNIETKRTLKNIKNGK